MGAEAEGRGGGEVVTPTTSPKNRLKLLCSHGGRIVPRSPDGHLKYVGGETRVVAVSCEITFSELMKKLNSLFDGDYLLKYQIIPEDLDLLVTVRNDEDLRHMVSEYERQENSGTPKLRTFLFPTTSIAAEAHSTSTEPPTLERRYIDAINGTISTTNSATGRPASSRFGVSSACSSPKTRSPDYKTLDGEGFYLVNGYVGAQGLHMHRVRSSPNVCSLVEYQHHHHYQLQDHHHHHHHSKGERLMAASPCPQGHGPHHHECHRQSPSKHHVSGGGRGFKRLDRSDSFPASSYGSVSE